MDQDPPLFAALLVSRPSAPTGLLRRGLLALLVSAGYAAIACGLLLTQLLVLETLPPPHATIGPIVTFRPPPAGWPGSGGGRPAPQGPVMASPPAIRPPAPRPTVVPLPPPSDQDSTPGASDPLPGDGVEGPVSDGPEGGGPGGSGAGGTGGGEGPGCASCIPGDERQEPTEGFYPENTPGMIPPVVITSTRALPKYPDIARRAGVEGTVILLVVIDRDGRVGEIQVLKSPDPRFGFDLAAIEAVKQWRYRPALLGTRPVAVQASVMLEFTISR